MVSDNFIVRKWNTLRTGKKIFILFQVGIHLHRGMQIYQNDLMFHAYEEITDIYAYSHLHKSETPQ